MYRDINNPNFSMFVKEDDSGGIPNEWEAMSDSSGHKSSAPIELWETMHMFYLLNKKMLHQLLKT